VCEQRIPDDEVLYRLIPPTMPYFEPPNRITSANFRLRKHKNELGLSTYCASIVSEEAVLAKEGAIEGSFVVEARVGDIRALYDGNGKPLNLDVVAVDDEDDPGHAEIRSTLPGRLSDSASNALKKLFKLT
jgi:hypothetical protein